MEPLSITIMLIGLFFLSLMVFFKFTKRFVKLLFMINIILMVIIGITGIFVYMDAVNLKNRFPSDPKLMILEEAGIVLSAVRLKSMAEAPDYIKEAELLRYQQLINKDDYGSLLENNYKIFVISIESLLPIDGIDIGEDVLDQKNTLKLLHSENALRDLAKHLFREQTGVTEQILDFAEADLADQFGSSAELKSRLFGIMLSQDLQEDGLFIIHEYKEDRIIIYPDTIVFRFMKFIPKKIVDELVKL
ncbi:MAG: hypothetical protein KJ709_02305 [Nanoarchaeota archaeon]|nr:hypothetical protein [Nanoarchaeota archaeon]